MTGKAVIQVQVRRIYEPPAPADGVRVLVDRIWPRGLTRANAALDEWCKEVAPSTALRKWYGHDPQRFEEFSQRYRVELEDEHRSKLVSHLREVASQRALTLLTATKDIQISAAKVLMEVLSR
ncbi:MAG: DUF488 family protein [Actinobacteria bacterium]|nr:DUF488 family protein [Actinomycetota bacterium]